MNIVSEFPRRVREIRHTEIPMPDGCKLAARIWLPEDAEENPVPAILEYIPYRKNDLTAERDAANHAYFAGHGYAGVRVDLRGSGESGGVLTDEYLQQELDDGYEVIRWLAEQPWCSGAVGMIGISWGGFNGLQIAAMRPPALKAVISICSTDDRYADDVHHMGGCLLGDNLSWASVMFAYNSLPPDPAHVGDDWRRMWMERLEGSGLWLEKWLSHQRRDDYWKHGSVCEDYDAIQCPIYAVSGWADGYSNAVFRLLSGLSVPRKGLIGPWSHKYPHLGKPGPAVGFLQEAVRWWDQWLKGEETGIMDEPMLRAWLQDSVPPTTSYDIRPGRWVGEREWPSPHVQETRFTLAPGFTLVAGEYRGAEAATTVQSPLSVGLFAGKWCSYAATPDLPHDQREEDGGALVFESEPLEQHTEILGQAAVELELMSDRPVAMVAVRLSDVAPNGQATRVTYGLLNLCQRDSREEPTPLEPGKRYRVRVPMNDVAQAFPKAHCVRVSISTSYFPIAWPSPEPVMLTVLAGRSHLILPVRPPRAEDAEIPEFPPPESAPPLEMTLLEPTHHNWWVVRDLAADESTLEVIEDNGAYRQEDNGMEVRKKTQEWYSYRGHDFTSPRGEVQAIRRMRRGGWQAETWTRTVLTADETHFRIRAELDAYEGDTRVFSKSWDRTIPRDNV